MRDLFIKYKNFDLIVFISKIKTNQKNIKNIENGIIGIIKPKIPNNIKNTQINAFTNKCLSFIYKYILFFLIFKNNKWIFLFNSLEILVFIIIGLKSVGIIKSFKIKSNTNFDLFYFNL